MHVLWIGKVVDTCVLNLKSGRCVCSQIEKWSIHVFLIRKVVDACVLNLKSGRYVCSQLKKWSTSTTSTTAIAQQIIVASHYGEDERRMCMGKLSKTHRFLLAICSMAYSHPRFIRQMIFAIQISLYRVSWRHRGGAEIYIHQIWVSALNENAWSTPRPGRSIPLKEPRLGGRQGLSRWVWWTENLFAQRGSNPEPPSRQHSYYTSNDIPARLYLRL